MTHTMFMSVSDVDQVFAVKKTCRGMPDQTPLVLLSSLAVSPMASMKSRRPT